MTIEEAIRKKLAPALWERAGVWAEQGAVSRDASGAAETFHVRIPGGAGGFEVTLWPDENEWACSCELPCCAHVAAAARARAGGAVSLRELPRVRYHLKRTVDGLELDRTVPGGAAHRDEDAVLNRLLAGWWARRGLPRGLLKEALGALRGLPVDLDGEPVTTDGTMVLPRALVEDDPPGWKVRLVRAGGIDEAFKNGALRMGKVVRPFGDPDLDPVLRQRLLIGIPFGVTEAERLVTEFLPALRKLLDVEVRSARLPDLLVVPPRVELQVVTRGIHLLVTPLLVYGDPAVARVERGELVRIGKGMPARDREAEARLARQVGEAGMAFGLTVEKSAVDAVLWLDQLRGPLREVISTRAPGFRMVRATIDPRVEIRTDGDGFRVHVEAGGVAPDALVRAWEEGDRLVPLLGGGWVPTPKAWLEQHGAVLSELLSASDGAGRIARSAAPLLLDAAAALDIEAPPALDALRALAGDFDAVPRVPLAPSFRGTLREYQMRGVDWILWLASVGMGGVLADDMGLGKTVQCLAAVATRRGRTLVIAPTSVIRNWASEAAKFTPDLSVCVYHGPRRALDPAAALTLTTWAILRLDTDVLTEVVWDTVFLDEAQAMKNPESQVAGAARRLRAGLRLCVTGTPVENRLEELWSLFQVANPGLLGGRKAFRDRFETPIRDGHKRPRDDLRRRIRPFVLRRLKRDVAKELPARTDVVMRCQLSADERSLYESVRSLGRAEVARLLDGGRTLQVLEVLLRMRQAACHPGLLPGKEAPSSAKVDLLLETLEEVVSEGHRALVFSQWTGFLDLLEAPLRAAGLGFCRLDGTTRDRAAVVAQFSAEDGPPVFLLSLKAGGVGLNLTAADYVFLLDPWWNPTVEDQATDRAHRIGQTRPVMAYRLIAEDTVEERILALQATKRRLAAAALDDEALQTSVTRDELLALLD